MNDKPELAHLVSGTKKVVLGNEYTALCGYQWTPTRDKSFDIPLCPACLAGLRQEREDILRRIYIDMARSMEQDEWALIRWGKHWVDCTEHERSEAMRLRHTPPGGGYKPLPEDE